MVSALEIALDLEGAFSSAAAGKAAKEIRRPTSKNEMKE
jgi:hypothetical protein